jgi:hypothetical protein
MKTVLKTICLGLFALAFANVSHADETWTMKGVYTKVESVISGRIKLVCSGKVEECGTVLIIGNHAFAKMKGDPLVYILYNIVPESGNPLYGEALQTQFEQGIDAERSGVEIE